jgi:glutathione S-transferase
MPATVDHEPLGGGAPLTLFESGAILEYLADKTGRFLPRAGAARYAVLQWVYWQMANLGPMMGNANHFKTYAKRLCRELALPAPRTQTLEGRGSHNPPRTARAKALDVFVPGGLVPKAKSTRRAFV